MRKSVDSWHVPPADLALSSEDVHVWRADLDVPEAVRHRMQQHLSPDEWKRAERFHFENARQRFVVGRGLLRVILARYRACSPKDLCFSYNEYGKPALAGGHRGTLRFNVAHSRGKVLYAVTRGREVGVDLEYMRENIDVEKIVDRFFSAREVATFWTVPAPLRRDAFFNGWARKEAYIKAHGKGLALPLDQFDVSLAPDAPALLLSTHSEEHDVLDWSLRALDAGPGYKAAVVAEGKDWQLSCWQWGSEP